MTEAKASKHPLCACKLYRLIIMITILMGGYLSFQINSGHHRAESFEACCQWVLHNAQIITLLFAFAVQKYIFCNYMNS